MGEPKVEPRELIDLDSALALLPDRPVLRIVLGIRGSPPGSAVQAQATRLDIEKLLRYAPEIDIAGPGSRAIGFGLAVLSPDGQAAIFIETCGEVVA